MQLIKEWKRSTSKTHRWKGVPRMFPSKNDIQFFYDLGLYTVEDIDFFFEAGYLTETERREIVGEEENSEVEV